MDKGKITETIRKRWNEVSEIDILRSESLTGLAATIAQKTGDHEAQIEEELAKLFGLEAKDHPYYRNYVRGTTREKGIDIYPPDDGLRGF